MRLFVALPAANAVRQTIAPILDELRTAHWPVRWVRADRLHVTLRFFGETDSSRGEAIGRMLADAVVGIGPMAGELVGLALLPGGRRARAVHLELDAPPALELMQDRIARGAEALGFAPEGRLFRPHVTVARVRAGARLSAAALERLEATLLAIPFPIDHVVLYQSRLTAQGPDYTALYTYTLTG
jgi:2'-5' RNA ligase